MAKQKIPYALDMRRMKYGEASDAELKAVAQALRAAGRRAEVILLFERRPDHPMLLEEARDAIEEGRSFELLAVRRLGVPVSDEQLATCAAKARRDGRKLDAYHCYVALGDDAAIAEIADALPKRLRPAAVAPAEG